MEDVKGVLAGNSSKSGDGDGEDDTVSNATAAVTVGTVASTDVVEKMRMIVEPILKAFQLHLDNEKQRSDFSSEIGDDKTVTANMDGSDDRDSADDSKVLDEDDNKVSFPVTLKVVCKNLFVNNQKWFQKSYPGYRLVQFVTKLSVHTTECPNLKAMRSAVTIIQEIMDLNLLSKLQVMLSVKDAALTLSNKAKESTEPEKKSTSAHCFAFFLVKLFGTESDFTWLVHLGDLGAKEEAEFWTSIVSRVIFVSKLQLPKKEVQKRLDATPNLNQLPIVPLKEIQDQSTDANELDFKSGAGNLDYSLLTTPTASVVVRPSSQASIAKRSTPHDPAAFVLKASTNCIVFSKGPSVSIPDNSAKLSPNKDTSAKPFKSRISYPKPNQVSVSTQAAISSLSCLMDLPVSTHPLAKPPVPPNWEASCNEAIQSLKPYSRISVPTGSQEYLTLAALLQSSLTITKLERIVNVDVWRRFKHARKEMLLQKSDDMKLLEALGLTDEELARRAHILHNFEKEGVLHSSSVPYSDNMALLFHCSRGNLEDVLSQGLDERVGNAGRLGKGIYFADDPAHAMSYDGNSTLLIFGVVLGDCLTAAVTNTLVREPTKSAEQKRSPTDLFFDSIVGRPGGQNEYVIFNRNQCCPLYAVAYTRLGVAAAKVTQPPPFVWVTAQQCQSGASVVMPSASSAAEWHLLARAVFGKMKGDEKAPDPVYSPMRRSTSMGFESASSVHFGPIQRMRKPSPALFLINKKLEELHEFGFTDDTTNMTLLQIFDYDIEQTLDSLLEGATQAALEIDQNGVKAPPVRRRNNAAVGVSVSTDGEDDEDDCLICTATYSKSNSNWKKLICNHEVCTACYNQLQKSGTTMSGHQHSFIKCPFCKKASGLEIGSCPNGSMTVTEVADSAPGYEKHNTLCIRYLCTGSTGLDRNAYVPNSPEGKEVVELLKTAWDRRLCFSIGTSVTTGQKNTVVWNIHHKSAITGGVQGYGYPDPTYLSRVKEELAQYGIQ